MIDKSFDWLTLWVFTWALNKESQSFAILCILAQLALTFATSTMAHGVLKEVKGLPTKAFVRASLEGSRASSPLGVDVCWAITLLMVKVRRKRKGKKKGKKISESREDRSWSRWGQEDFFPLSLYHLFHNLSVMSTVIKENVSHRQQTIARRELSYLWSFFWLASTRFAVRSTFPTSRHLLYHCKGTFRWSHLWIWNHSSGFSGKASPRWVERERERPLQTFSCPHSDLYLWFFLRWHQGAHCSHYQEHWESFEECWIGFEPPRKGQRESERVKCWFWLEFRERVGQDNRNLRALDENLAKGF